MGYLTRIHETPVFDRHRVRQSRISQRNVLAPNNSSNHIAGFSIHRNSRDRAVPSAIVTAIFMGDPAPGRSAQDAYERHAR
jgi:hypothetical protein